MPPTDAQLQDLYTRHAHVIHRRCLSILGNEEEARDAVQETFARVILSWDAFRQESSPLTWMYRISTNWCLNRIRNRGGQERIRARHQESLVGATMGAGKSEASENEETIRRLLDQADEETRAIVIHLFFDDMTREETARLVGISVPTLRKRLERFLARARKSIDPTLSAISESLTLIAGVFSGLLAQGGAL